MDILPYAIKMFAVGLSIGVIYGVICLISVEILHIFKKSAE